MRVRPPTTDPRSPLTLGGMISVLAVLLIAAASLIGCSDDPIIGPTNDDTSGGGSYGVIHFRTEAAADSASVPEEYKKENPKRF